MRRISMTMKIVRKKPVYGSTPAEIKEFYRKKDANAKVKK